MKKEKKDKDNVIETNEKFLTEAELAELLGLSTESIRKMRVRGFVDAACTIPFLPHYRITARSVRYKMSDCRTWTEQFKIGA